MVPVNVFQEKVDDIDGAYLLFCGLYAAKTSQNRQIQYIRFLMERDEKHVKIHEAFSYAGFSLTA